MHRFTVRLCDTAANELEKHGDARENLGLATHQHVLLDGKSY